MLLIRVTLLLFFVCGSLFFNKVAGLKACNFMKKEAPTDNKNNNMTGIKEIMTTHFINPFFSNIYFYTL